MRKKLIDVLQNTEKKCVNEAYRQKIHFIKIKFWCIIYIRK